MISTLKLEFAKSICEFFGTAFFLFLGMNKVFFWTSALNVTRFLIYNRSQSIS